MLRHGAETRSVAVLFIRRGALIGAVALAASASVAPAAVRVGPSIRSVSPSAARRGDTVEVRGTGFGAGNVQVAVGGVPATVLSANGTSARFVVPDGAPSGETTVRTVNPGGQGGEIGFRVLGFDGNVQPQLDEGAAVSAAIGSTGGVVTTGRFTLSVPAGALHEDTTITMTPLTDVGGSPLGPLAGGVQLEPSGLHFLTPATLTIAVPAGIDPSELVGFGFDAGGTSFHLMPHQLVGNTVTIQIAHFSGAGTASATLDQIKAAVAFVPTFAEEAAEEQIEAARATLTGDALDFALDEALDRWYADLKDRLQVVPDLNTLELALGDWQAWDSNVETWGRIDEHADQNLEATALATIAAGHVANQLLGSCTSSAADPFAALKPIIRLRADLTIVPLPIETTTTASTGEHLPSADALPTSCVHIELGPLTTPPVFARNLPALPAVNPVSADMSVAFWSGGHRTDIPLNVRLVDFSDPADATGRRIDSDTVVTGHYAAEVTPEAFPFANLRLEVAFQAAVDDNDKVLQSFSVAESRSVPVLPRIDLKGKGPTDPTLTDAPAAVDAGDAVLLRVQVAGSDLAGATVDFALSGPGSLGAPSATTDANGFADVTYLAPSVAGGTTVSIQATVGGGATAGSDTLVLTIDPAPVVVEVSPSSTTVVAGETVQFAATVHGTANTAVTWTTTGSNTIDDTGLFKAGATAGTFSVVAHSIADPTAKGTASVTVLPGLVANVTRESIGARTFRGLGPFSDSLEESDVEAPSGNEPLSVTFKAHAGANQIVSIDVRFDVLANGVGFNLVDGVAGSVSRPACGRMNLIRGSQVVYSVDTCAPSSQGSAFGALPPGSYDFSIVLVGSASSGDWEATAELHVTH